MGGRLRTALFAALTGCLSSPPVDPGGDPDAAPVDGGADASIPCVPREEFPAFEDPFVDDLLNWAEPVYVEPTDSPMAVEVIDEVLRVELVDMAAHMLILKSRPVDLQGVRLTLRMVEVPNPAVTGARAWLAVLPDNLPEDAVQIMYLEDRLELPNGEIDYDPAMDLWWQIRVTESEIAMETAPDGIAWKQIDAVPLPAGMDTATLEIGTKTDTNEPGAGRLVVDDLNLPPNRCE